MKLDGLWRRIVAGKLHLWTSHFWPHSISSWLWLEMHSVERGICPYSHVHNERTVPIIMAGCTAHAQNGRISTSGEKSDISIVFLDPNFLKDAKISAIRIHLRQIWDYLVFAQVFRTFWPKMGGFVGQNMGKDGTILTPNELVLPFGGFLRMCQFWWKSIKKCDHESARRWTDTHTDRQKPSL